MIRINLLPVKAAQKKEQLRNQLIVMSITLLLTIAGCFIFYSSIQSDISDLKSEITRNKKEIAKLQKKIGEVNKFKKLQEELKSKLEVLASLKAAKSGPVHLMDDLINSLPDKLWITSYIVKGTKISLKGVGLSEEEVASFMTQLEASPYYKNVKLKVTKQKIQRGLRLQTFDLSCQVEKHNPTPVLGE